MKYLDGVSFPNGGHVAAAKASLLGHLSFALNGPRLRFMMSKIIWGKCEQVRLSE